MTTDICLVSWASWGESKEIKERENKDKSGVIDYQASQGLTNQCDFEGDGGHLLCFTFLAPILHSADISTPTSHLRTLVFPILHPLNWEDSIGFPISGQLAHSMSLAPLISSGLAA